MLSLFWLKYYKYVWPNSYVSHSVCFQTLTKQTIYCEISGPGNTHDFHADGKIMKLELFAASSFLHIQFYTYKHKIHTAGMKASSLEEWTSGPWFAWGTKHQRMKNAFQTSIPQSVSLMIATRFISSYVDIFTWHWPSQYYNLKALNPYLILGSLHTFNTPSPWVKYEVLWYGEGPSFPEPAWGFIHKMSAPATLVFTKSSYFSFTNLEGHFPVLYSDWIKGLFDNNVGYKVMSRHNGLYYSYWEFSSCKLTFQTFLFIIQRETTTYPLL